MDDRPGIFERIPLFFLTVAALLLAAAAGVWLQGDRPTSQDQCATLSRDDYGDDLAAECDDDFDLADKKKKNGRPNFVAVLNRPLNNHNDTDDTDDDDDDDDSPPNGTYDDTPDDDSPDTDT